jgi:hypothetical protein
MAEWQPKNSRPQRSKKELTDVSDRTGSGDKVVPDEPNWGVCGLSFLWAGRYHKPRSASGCGRSLQLHRFWLHDVALAFVRCGANPAVCCAAGCGSVRAWRGGVTDARIEAAAAAIHNTFANRSGKARAWERLPELMRERYREEAKAALEAAGGVTDL